MTRLILTLAQAHDLQQLHGPDDEANLWPGPWSFLLDIAIPDKPDTMADPHRMMAGMMMLELGCTDEQIAEQLGWKMPSGPLKTLHRLIRRK